MVEGSHDELANRSRNCVDYGTPFDDISRYFVDVVHGNLVDKAVADDVVEYKLHFFGSEVVIRPREASFVREILDKPQRNRHIHALFI